MYFEIQIEKNYMFIQNGWNVCKSTCYGATERSKKLGSATKEALTFVLSLSFITTIPDASFTKDFRKWATGTAPTREARNSKGAG